MFQPTLEKLVAQAQARWGMIVGNDGVLLETDRKEFHQEAEALAAEYAAYIKAARKAVGDTGLGDLHQCLLATESGKILFQILTQDYFLALCLGQGSFAGKACFEISRIIEPLEKELSI
jgi:predicted regulator of Ras-like GTPase activity (Roadblock/LC7/MglB family)